MTPRRPVPAPVHHVRPLPPPPDRSRRRRPAGGRLDGALLTVVALAASEVDSRCPHDPTDDPLEGCWRHPEAGLMCPACSIDHRADPVLHPWDGDEARDVCDCCGSRPALPWTLTDPTRWEPHTTPQPVTFSTLGHPAVWTLELCERCAHGAGRSRRRNTVT